MDIDEDMFSIIPPELHRDVLRYLSPSTYGKLKLTSGDVASTIGSDSLRYINLVVVAKLYNNDPKNYHIDAYIIVGGATPVLCPASSNCDIPSKKENFSRDYCAHIRQEDEIPEWDVDDPIEDKNMENAVVLVKTIPLDQEIIKILNDGEGELVLAMVGKYPVCKMLGKWSFDDYEKTMDTLVRKSVQVSTRTISVEVVYTESITKDYIDYSNHHLSLEYVRKVLPSNTEIGTNSYYYNMEGASTVYRNVFQPKTMTISELPQVFYIENKGGIFAPCDEVSTVLFIFDEKRDTYIYYADEVNISVNIDYSSYNEGDELGSMTATEIISILETHAEESEEYGEHTSIITPLVSRNGSLLITI